MRKNFNSVQTLKSREDCYKYSKSVSYETLVGGTTTSGRECGEALEIEGVITRRTLVRRGYLPEQGTHANEESLFASVTWLMRLPRRIQRMLLVMTIPTLALLLSFNLSTAFAGTTCNWDGTKLIISGSGTFNGCLGNSQRTATEVTIGTGVTKIGDYTFLNASSLTSITIPEGVTSIGDQAFYNASSLKSITIPDSVEIIGKEAFRGATGLTSITIPDSVESIGESAFLGASSLTSITIPEGVTSIGYRTFWGTGLTSITIPDSVTSIGTEAFQNATGLTSITIPDSVTSIGSSAFWNASSLTNIICKGDEASCADTVNALRAKGYKGKISYPDNKTSCEGSDISLYVWDDRNRKCRRRNENQCNATGKYYYNGATCLYRPRDRQIVCVNPNYKANDGYCDRLRYTPAEAAEVLRNDNTNSVTITFKK